MRTPFANDKLSFLSKIKAFLGNRLGDTYSQKSYSQEGEDMILRRIFETKKYGFYVDVGAYHPKLYSNTYFFYRNGWRGINIEPNPASIRLFQAQRPLDTNLSVGVSDISSERTYHMFNEPALNTFEEKVAQMSSRKGGQYFRIGAIPVKTARLDKILDEHLPEDQGIDFISVDVEGHELEVVRSNDWKRYRPACLLVEVLGTDIHAIMQSDLHYFMAAANYSLYAKTANTIFYMDDSR